VLKDALVKKMTRQPATDLRSDSHVPYFILKLCLLSVSPTDC